MRIADSATPASFAGEVRVAYRRYGAVDASAATPVVLVHGFASTAEITWGRTGWVSSLQRSGREVVTLDLRGHGESDAPTDAEAYRLPHLGGDVLAVLDAIGAPEADLVGYSLGSRVVAAAAALAPERVRRIVLGGAGPSELFASWDLEQLRAVLRAEASDQGGTADAADATDATAAAEAVEDADPADPAAEAVMRQVLEPALRAGADRAALLACVEGVIGSPLTLPRGIPALVVAGSLDPVAAGAEAFAAEAGATFLEIPGRDHVSTLTAREFRSAASTFLA